MENEVTVDYSTKLENFQKAINAYPKLMSLYRNTDQDGYNDHDDRYWTAIFHRVNQVDDSLDKTTRLSFGNGKISQSKIFVFDHQSKHSIAISVEQHCFFARFLEEQNLLVYQSNKEIALIKVMNMQVAYIQKLVDKKINIKNIIPEQNGLGYLAVHENNDDSPGLIKYSFEDKVIDYISLPGYMTRFGIIHECAVYEEKGQAIVVVLGVSAQQKSDPDMGYSVFVKNGENDGHLYNFQNVWFQNWTPRVFKFATTRNKKRKRIRLIASGKQQSFESYVPTNMK